MGSMEMVIESFRYTKTTIRTMDSQIGTPVQELPKQVEMPKTYSNSTNPLYLSGIEAPKQLTTNTTQPINTNYLNGMDMDVYNKPSDQYKQTSTLSSVLGNALKESKSLGHIGKKEEHEQAFTPAYQINNAENVSGSYINGKG